MERVLSSDERGLARLSDAETRRTLCGPSDETHHRREEVSWRTEKMPSTTEEVRFVFSGGGTAGQPMSNTI